MVPMLVCPGCKADFVSADRAPLPPPHVGASRECWYAFLLLMNRFYSRGNGLFPYRQWPIDAYMLQHAKLDVAAGKRVATLSLATSRMSLTAPSSVSRGPHLHQHMSEAKDMPQPQAPRREVPELTIQSVLNLPDERELINASHDWARAALKCWEDSLPEIDAWLKRHDYFMERITPTSTQ